MADVLRDLEATQTFLTTVNNPQGQEQQATSWIQRLTVLSVTPTSAAELASVLSRGPWTNAQRDRLNEALNTALVSGPDKVRRALQQCSNFKAYLSRADIQSLQSSEVSFLGKVDVVTTRMLRIGLHCPSEKCFGYIVALVQGLANVQSNDDDLKTMLEEYKKSLRNKKKNIPRPSVHLVLYPVDPNDLPQELLASGYDQNDPPSRLNVGPDDLRPVGPLRHHNKRLAKNRVPDMAMASSGSVAAGGVHGMLMNMMMQQQQLFMQMQGMNVQDPELPGLHLFKPKKNKQLALMDQSESAAAGQPASAAAGQPAGAAAGQPASAALAEVPRQSVQQVATPQKSALQLPPVTPQPQNDSHVVSAEEQAKMVADAMHSRKEEKAPKPKSKAKAKAKATAKAKGSTKSAPQAKASPKPKAKGKAKAKAAPSLPGRLRPLEPFWVNGRLLTPTFRQKLYPNGCSKCRFRKGCTKSCWTDRKF